MTDNLIDGKKPSKRRRHNLGSHLYAVDLANMAQVSFPWTFIHRYWNPTEVHFKTSSSTINNLWRISKNKQISCIETLSTLHCTFGITKSYKDLCSIFAVLFNAFKIPHSSTVNFDADANKVPLMLKMLLATPKPIPTADLQLSAKVKRDWHKGRFEKNQGPLWSLPVTMVYQSLKGGSEKSWPP